MGKKDHIHFYLLIGLILLVGCSPKIAEIGDKDITYSDFIILLQENHPSYFRRKRVFIEKQLKDWKRIKTALIDYFSEEVIWRNLKQNDFHKSIPPKKKKLFYLTFLGDITYKTQKKLITLKMLKAKEKTLLFDKTALEDSLNKMNTVNQSNVEKPFLIINDDFSLTLKEINSYFQAKNKDKLKSFIIKKLVPKLYFALEGKRLRYDKIDSFQKRWALEWRQYLIHLYEDKIKDRYKREILIKKEDLLRNYYKKNKSRYVMYRSKGNQDDSREKYQFSYNRVKSDIVDIFVNKEISIWKEKLWNKYHFRLSKSYFDTLEHQEAKKLNLIQN